MKRIGLYLLTNLAVMMVFGVALNVILALTGIQAQSISGILVMAALFGFGGSIISLFMSKSMALRSVGGTIITQPKNATEQWLVTTISNLASKSDLKTPQIAIYNSNDMNAFATGAKRNDSLIAVSTALLNNMQQDEVEAVLAHEMSHIANGDMVTLTLIQGVVNTFVIFAARLVAGVASGMISSDDDEPSEGGSYMLYFLVSSIMEVLFGFLASIIVMWFSREREFRADSGSAKLVGSNKMIAALKRLQQGQQSELEGSFAAFGINGKRSFSEFFMSHPPLEKRIAALENNK